jgi:hypothetical protein
MNELIELLQNNPNAANAFGALASAVAAVLALLVSVVAVLVAFATSRSQRAHNELSVQPFADVTVANYEDSLRVKLQNNGNGPMILKAITVSDGKEALPSLIDWMPELPHSRAWNYYSKNFHLRSLRAGSDLTLLELSEADGETHFADLVTSFGLRLRRLP